MTPMGGTAPVLDAPPASPGSVNAAPPSADSQMKSLAPEQNSQEMALGGMQSAEITLKLGQAIGQGLTYLSQINPPFAPLGNQMLTMLRQGLMQVLEQGLGTSEQAPGLPGGGGGSAMSSLAPMTQGMPMPEEGSPSPAGY